MKMLQNIVPPETKEIIIFIIYCVSAYLYIQDSYSYFLKFIRIFHKEEVI
jgi:hypothetical protein